MLLSLGLLFLVGLSLGAIFEKLHLPNILGLLLAGIMLGPNALDLIDTSILGISTELRQIALIIILTRAGLSLSINDLKKVGRPAILMCFLPACFEIIGMLLLAPKLLGITILEAAIMGSVIAAVSPAVVVPRMLKLIENGYGKNKSIPQIIMAGASVDDIFVIVLFTSFTSLATGNQVSYTQFIQIPISIILGAIVGGICGYLLTLFFKKVHIRDTIKLLIILSLTFFLVSFEKIVNGSIPFSGLFAVMVVGIAIFQFYPRLSKRISLKFNKLWVVAEILLFVLVGATVDIHYALAAGFNVIILILLVILFRMFGVFVCMLKTPLNPKERLFCMIAYTPKATVQAAIGSLPLAMGLACGNIVLTAAVVSILLSAPLGAIGIDLLYKKLLVKS